MNRKYVEGTKLEWDVDRKNPWIKGEVEKNPRESDEDCRLIINYEDNKTINDMLSLIHVEAYYWSESKKTYVKTIVNPFTLGGLSWFDQKNYRGGIPIISKGVNTCVIDQTNFRGLRRQFPDAAAANRGGTTKRSKSLAMEEEEPKPRRRTGGKTGGKTKGKTATKPKAKTTRKKNN